MFLQHTIWPLNRDFFQTRHSPVLIQLQVVAQRILRDIHQPGNLPVR